MMTPAADLIALFMNVLTVMHHPNCCFAYRKPSATLMSLSH